ncbi:MAG: ABC transporter permease [Bacteroidota bacterium]
MNKIWLIIKREYLTRVKKKSFIIMTILGPLLMAGLMIVPVFIAQMSDQQKKVAVIDETGMFFEKFKTNEDIKFEYLTADLETAKSNMKKNDWYAVLYIPKTELAIPEKAILYSEKQPSLSLRSYIERSMQYEIENLKLLDVYHIDKKDIESIKTSINLTTIKISDGGKEQKSYSEISFVLGLFGGILIYFFIFLFGAQVMRGVIEEKTNRIVEIIVSSVKPFQLMMGKIIGVAFVGLTQFLLWIVLTLAIYVGFSQAFPDKFNPKKHEVSLNAEKNLFNTEQITAKAQMQPGNEELNNVIEGIHSINFMLIIGVFIFYFIGGYLLYAAMFAAIGAAVDSEADTQQFMLPVTVPLIFSIVMLQFILNNPEGPIAFWLSIIPFTSPIVMMIRIPFGISYYELLLSMSLLVIGFLLTTWMAAKIYRTGILMYGKKVSYKELFKWLTYKA